MNSRLTQFLFCGVIVALLCIGSAVFGGEVTLTSKKGQTLTGEMVRTDAAKVVFRTGGKTLNISLGLLDQESKEIVLMGAPWMLDSHPKISGAEATPILMSGISGSLSAVRAIRSQFKDDIAGATAAKAWVAARDAGYDRKLSREAASNAYGLRKAELYRQSLGL